MTIAMQDISRFRLGTASFQNGYAVTTSMDPDGLCKQKILESCLALGLTSIDTSPSYGDALSVISMRPKSSEWRIHSKVHPNVNLEDWWQLEQSVKGDLQTAGLATFASIGLHSPAQLFASKSGARNMARLVKQGYAESWGFSVYSPDEIPMAFEIAQPDFVQAPVNFLDRRFLSAGVLDILASEGVELHARSVFLKGLLLNPKTIRTFGTSVLQEFFKRAQKQGISPYSLALKFVLDQASIDQVILGVAHPDELAKLKNSLSELPEVLDHGEDPDAPIELLDPRLWQ